MKTHFFRIGISVFLLSLSFTTVAQTDFESYVPIESEGTLPKDFRSSTYDVVKVQQKGIASETKDKFEQEALENFYLESNYAVDELLRSGKVLFNDKVSTYVNDVVDEILKGQPALRQKLRFYVVKSPIPNAFTNQRGVILVNLGLLSRLETEAQLAYILCHEISHYILKHNQDLYLESKNIEYGRGEYRKASNYDRLLTRSAYSRENEKEADLEGLELFLKTKYDYSQLGNVFLLLRDAGKPTMPLFTYETLWPASFLNDEAIAALIEKMPEPPVAETSTKKKRKKGSGFITGFETEEELEEAAEEEEVAEENNEAENVVLESEEEETQEEEEEDEDDDFSTHPAPLERKAAIEEKIGKRAGSATRSLFLVSPARFVETNLIAKYEMAELYIQNMAYYDGIYHCLLMMQNGESNPYLKATLGKALYGYAKYEHAREEYPEILDYEGNTPETLYSLEERLDLFSREELLLLALDYNGELFQNQPENVHIKRILVDLLIDVQYELAERESDEEEFFDKRVADIQAEGEWTELWEAAEKEKERLDRREAFFDSNAGRKEVKKWRKKIQRKGYQLGIDKIVVFDPIYIRIDDRNDQAIRYVASEQEQRRMHALIEESADKLDLEVEILDSKILGDKISSDYWNDMALISSWHKEKLNHELSRIVSSQYGSVQDLIDKYGTPYFFHTGALSVRERNPGKYLYGCCLISSVFGAPIGLYVMLSPDEESAVFGILYDLMDESTEAVMFNEMNVKANSTILESNIYYELYQIKSPQK